MQEPRFTGKVVLVTGAGRGIGRAIALAFAREGAAVALNYQVTKDGAEDAAAEARSLGVPATTVAADVSRPDEVAAMVAEVERELGPIDILINNAAMFDATPFFELTEERWDRVHSVNLKGMFLCSQAVARTMVQRGGVIINLVSGGSLSADPGYEASAVYTSSKAGALMLTHRMALDLAPAIRVNAVAPGMIDSKPEQMSDAFRERYAAKTPLRRIGRPDEIAAAVLFVASDEASFITGQTINVDGGVLLH